MHRLRLGMAAALVLLLVLATTAQGCTQMLWDLTHEPVEIDETFESRYDVEEIRSAAPGEAPRFWLRLRARHGEEPSTRWLGLRPSEADAPDRVLSILSAGDGLALENSAFASHRETVDGSTSFQVDWRLEGIVPEPGPQIPIELPPEALAGIEAYGGLAPAPQPATITLHFTGAWTGSPPDDSRQVWAAERSSTPTPISLRHTDRTIGLDDSIRWGNVVLAVLATPFTIVIDGLFSWWLPDDDQP